jgi:hypothetical protein
MLDMRPCLHLYFRVCKSWHEAPVSGSIFSDGEGLPACRAQIEQNIGIDVVDV